MRPTTDELTMDTRNATAASPSVPEDGDESDAVFASAAELFRLLATPMRLKIISALCGHEIPAAERLVPLGMTKG